MARYCKRQSRGIVFPNYRGNLPATYPYTYDDLGMGYQALLFCPDEKSAQTLTQLLGDLDFSVEACIEPFAAVKKLMGQSFDALVVDCENEQNAALLFKSARGSASNQASLAVAVVDGQGGVAKAFRIGANLVLTKPINIEQAKGTLRVARGLLRKNDPAKVTGPVVTPSAATAKPATGKTVPSAKPDESPNLTSLNQTSANHASTNLATASTSKAAASALSTSVSATKFTAITSSRPSAQDEILSESIEDESPPIKTAQPVSHTSGAASAPAPARVPEKAPTIEMPAEAVTDSPESPAKAASEPNKTVGSEPSLTFGGNNVEPQSSGKGKKILLWVAAAVLIGAAAYFGWTQYQGLMNPSRPSSAPAHQPSSGPPPLTAAPAKPTPASVAGNSESAHGPSPAASQTQPTSPPPAAPDLSSQHPSTATLSSNKGLATVSHEPVSLPIKSVQPAATAKPPAPDVPAPSIAGMGAPAAGTPLPKLLVSDGNAVKPELQAVNVSQGVSQGLLIKKVMPLYPTSALQLHVEGKVELLATISRKGDVTHTQVLSGDPRLTPAASDAVRQWKYKPYLLNGEPVETQTHVTLDFKLPH
jgi:periplasmic protein TonB